MLAAGETSGPQERPAACACPGLGAATASIEVATKIQSGSEIEKGLRRIFLPFLHEAVQYPRQAGEIGFGRQAVVADLDERDCNIAAGQAIGEPQA